MNFMNQFGKYKKVWKLYIFNYREINTKQKHSHSPERGLFDSFQKQTESGNF